MRKLISVLAIVLMLGCVTTSEWKQEEKKGVTDACMMAMLSAGLPVPISHTYCTCMVNRLEQDIPEFDKKAISEWFMNGSQEATLFCENLTMKKFNLGR